MEDNRRKEPSIPLATTGLERWRAAVQETVRRLSANGATGDASQLEAWAAHTEQDALPVLRSLRVDPEPVLAILTVQQISQLDAQPAGTAAWTARDRMRADQAIQAVMALIAGMIRGN